RLWGRGLRVADVRADATAAAARDHDCDATTATHASAAERARGAATRLRAGERFDTVARDLADPATAAVPDGLVPATKLREYLGPSLTARALTLEPGEVTDPIADGDGYRVLQLVARQTPSAPPLATVAAELRTEM